MKIKDSIDVKSKNRRLNSQTIFLICALILIYCPFLYMGAISHYIEDTTIQIKVGLDSIRDGRFIPIEMYSWHENLNWIFHETMWYHLVGLAYKIMGILGVVGVAAIFNYSIAGICFYKNSSKAHPLVIVILAAVTRLLSFPNYIARPNLFSQLALTILIFVLLSEINTVKKSIIFVVISFLEAWFHGGMIPVMFVVFGVFIVFEFIFKNYKTALYYLGALVLGFVVSLLNPVGISGWTYSYLFVDNGTRDVLSQNIEWQPKVFTILEITIILIVIVAFAVDERVRKFDKETLIKLALICMFIIMTCKYCRFMNYLALMVVMFAPEEIQIFVNWLNDNLFKLDKKKLNLSDASNYILSAFCVGFAIFMTATSITNYFPTNTMSDISALAAFDEGVIDVIKERGYSRVYNNFDTGTWLAFNDIPVHIDNRCDLYMEVYSGKDYVNGILVMTNIEDMDAFTDEYSPDAVVLEMIPGTIDDKFYSELMESDRYSLVYDNVYESNFDGSFYRWVVFEVN